MLKRVNEILIGKDIDRGTIAAGDSVETVMANILFGEVAVLTQDMVVFDNTTDDYSTTPTIYVVEGTDEDREYVNSISGATIPVKRIILSSPIDGDRVRTYTKNSYVAKTEQTVSFPAITQIITSGTEFVLRVVYKDMIEILFCESES